MSKGPGTGQVVLSRLMLTLLRIGCTLLDQDSKGINFVPTSVAEETAGHSG